MHSQLRSNKTRQIRARLQEIHHERGFVTHEDVRALAAELKTSTTRIGQNYRIVSGGLPPFRSANEHHSVLESPESQIRKAVLKASKSRTPAARTGQRIATSLHKNPLDVYETIQKMEQEGILSKNRVNRQPLRRMSNYHSTTSQIRRALLAAQDPKQPGPKTVHEIARALGVFGSAVSREKTRMEREGILPKTNLRKQK